MNVDFGILADTAEALHGKLYLMGGAFDTLWAPSVPVCCPRMSLVIRLLFTPAEEGRQHTLEVHIMDADGRRMAKVGGPIGLGPRSPQLPSGWHQGILTVLNFADLKFENFGHYSFEILVNGSSLKSIPFRVQQQASIQPQ